MQELRIGSLHPNSSAQAWGLVFPEGVVCKRDVVTSVEVDPAAAAGGIPVYLVARDGGSMGVPKEQATARRGCVVIDGIAGQVGVFA